MFENEVTKKLSLVVLERSGAWYQYVEILKQMSIWDFKVGKIFFSKLFNSIYYVGNSFPILRESPDKVLNVVKLYVALKLGSGVASTYSLASDFRSRITSMYVSFYTASDTEELVMEPCLQPLHRDLPFSTGSPEAFRQQEQNSEEVSSPSSSDIGKAIVSRPVAYRIIQGAAEVCDKFLDYVPLVGKDMFPWMSTTEKL